MKRSETRYRLVQWIVVLFAFLIITLQLSFAQQSTGDISPDQQRPSAPNIAIGAGDLLNIVVFDTPELTTSARVNQDGEVNLPVLGMMRLAGFNTIDAARHIEDELRSRRLILEPHVTVFIAEYASQGATVMGEVRSPGVYPTLGTRTM